MLLSFLFLFFAVVSLLVSKKMHKNVVKRKQQYRIPKGKIMYSDLNKPASAFFSKRYKTTGKPDYVIIEKGRYIPVEFKSGSAYKPRQNHVLQLAAYCHLLEEVYGGFVPYGRLVYNDREFTIPFDPTLRFELESVLTTMRHVLQHGNVERNHDDLRRCKACSMRAYCTQRLA